MQKARIIGVLKLGSWYDNASNIFLDLAQVAVVNIAKKRDAEEAGESLICNQFLHRLRYISNQQHVLKNAANVIGINLNVSIPLHTPLPP